MIQLTESVYSDQIGYPIEMLDWNIVDEIIPEPLGGAHRDVEKQASEIDRVLKQSLQSLSKLSEEELLESRWEKFKHIGQYREVNM